MKQESKEKIIGYIDHIALPEFGIDQIACKIDTGAYTSTLHCQDLRIIEEEDRKVLCFNLYDPKFGITTMEEFRFEKFRERRVRSSNGQIENRYSIKTTIVLFDTKYKTEFTLSFRERMRFPILLGRRFLRGRFVVDVSKKDLSLKLQNNDQ